MTTNNSDLLQAVDQALDERSLTWAARWIEDSLTGETNERVIEFGKNMAMTLRAAGLPTRHAAVAGPRGDVATTARNRDVAQRVVMSTESVLGERFDIATRHELADRITAALDVAATSSPAESTETKCIHCQHGVDNFNAVTGLCEFDPEPENESAEFCGCKCEFNAAPPESTPVAGEKMRIPSDFITAMGELKDWNVTTSDTARRAADEIKNQVLEILRTQYPEIKWPGGTIGSIAFDVVFKHFTAAPADNDALLPELTAVFVTNAIRVHTLSNHGCKWHDCLAYVCYNNKELIQRARGEQPTTTKGDR